MSHTHFQRRRHRLSFRLAFFILISTTIVFFGAFGYSYFFTRHLLLQSVQESAAYLTQALVHRLEITLRGVERIPRYLSSRIESGSIDGTELESMLFDLIDNNPDVYGSTAAFEPYSMDPNTLRFAPYFYRGSTGEILKSDLTSEAYNYFLADWYNAPKTTKKAMWSEPYFDEGGGEVLMSTYSQPFFRKADGHRHFRGVVTADIALEDLVTDIAQASLYRTGYAFLISSEGLFVAHPDTDRIMRQSIFQVAEENRIPELHEIGARMIAGDEGFVEFTSVHTGRESLLYFAPVPASGWSVGVMIPKEELYADLSLLNKTVLLIGSLGFLTLFLFIIAISRSITKPLDSLARSTDEIAKGNLDASMPPIKVNDEVGQLTRSVDAMRLALKEYITNLTETTKARERIESELKIARTIQMNFLPKSFPPFPDHSEFDIHAVLEPAKEVGGDFYDFFFLDEDHLFFSVGDVSDKGVPAALFMAVTKTLTKGIAEQGLELSELLTRVNVELCHGNVTSMFVSLFCGMLNLRTGHLSYSNGGHNAPLVVRKTSADWLPLPAGLVLGAMDNATFQTRNLDLAAGDRLIAYTDGVTEAMNPALQPFSQERLKSEALGLVSMTPKETVVSLMTSVREFTQGAPQSDDITLLVLDFCGTRT